MASTARQLAVCATSPMSSRAGSANAHPNLTPPQLTHLDMAWVLCSPTLPKPAAWSWKQLPPSQREITQHCVPPTAAPGPCGMCYTRQRVSRRPCTGTPRLGTSLAALHRPNSIIKCWVQISWRPQTIVPSLSLSPCPPCFRSKCPDCAVLPLLDFLTTTTCLSDRF